MSDATGRRSFVRRLTLSFAAPMFSSCAHLSESTPVSRIGFLSGAGLPDHDAAFTEELRRLGHQEGKNRTIEWRLTRANSTDNATMPAELAQSDVSLIVASALPFALAVRNANPNMPMIIIACPGMVSNGFAQTLERPGGIYTGIDELPRGVTAKRLTLLKMAAPSVTRVALLSTTPGTGGHERQLGEAERTAADLGIAVKAYRAASPRDLEGALESIAADGMNGLLSFQSGLSLGYRQLIVDFAAERRIPAIYQATLFAEAGGFMTWAPDLSLQYREGARLVARILNGAKPGDLPVKHPAKYYLTINAGAAREIGLTLPPSLLAQATRVIL